VSGGGTFRTLNTPLRGIPRKASAPVRACSEFGLDRPGARATYPLEFTAGIRDARLRDLNARAESAQRRHEEGKKGLRRPDGSKLYSIEVYGEELKKLARERNGVLAEGERQAREAQLAVVSEIVRIENADPAGRDLPEELDRANLKRAFALDAVEAFGKKLEPVLASGVRASIFAYWMAGQRKRKEGRGAPL